MTAISPKNRKVKRMFEIMIGQACDLNRSSLIGVPSPTGRLFRTIWYAVPTEEQFFLVVSLVWDLG